MVGHYDQEHELRMFNCAVRLFNNRQDFLVVIVLNALSKRLK